MRIRSGSSPYNNNRAIHHQQDLTPQMEYTLNLVAERSVIRESIKGIIWTIFFHRLFGPITPTTNEFLSITYPMASDQVDLDTLMDEKINHLIVSEFKNRDVGQTGVINVRFLERNILKSKKKSSWFGQGRPEGSEDLKLWEIWRINLRCLPISRKDAVATPSSVPGKLDTTDLSGQSKLGEDNGLRSNDDLIVDKNNDIYEDIDKIQLSIKSFEANTHKIIDIVDTHKDHIPPITSLESSPFPFEIEVASNPGEKQITADDESWSKYIKKILE